MNTFEFTNKTLFLELYNNSSKGWFHLKFSTKKICVIVKPQHLTYSALKTKYTALEPEPKTNLIILIKYIKCLNTRDIGTEGKL